MERERANDPYASGKDQPAEGARDQHDYLRYIVVGTAVVLILLGISLGMSAFTMVRGIIEGPDTLAAHLDAWVGPGSRAQAEPPPESADEPEAAATPADAATATGVQADVPQRRDRPGPGAGRARASTRRAEASKDSEWSGFMSEFFELLRGGGMSRTVGALFILVFTVVLVRIPFAFLHAGINLLTANTVSPKKK